MLWGTPPATPGQAPRTCSPAEPISIHGAGGSASNEKSAHLWGQGGSAGGDAARQAPSLGPKTRWRWLLLSNRTPKDPVGKSRRGEGARDYARGRGSVRRERARAELSVAATAYAPTAPPRLRRCRRPPRGPPPEARWRQFRCPGSPDVQASPLRSSAPSPVGATSVRAQPARKTRGRCRGAEPGRSQGHARWAGPPTVCRRAVSAGDNPEELDSAPSHRGAVPAGGNVAEGGAAYLGRSVRGAWRVRGARLGPAAE